MPNSCMNCGRRTWKPKEGTSIMIMEQKETPTTTQPQPPSGGMAIKFWCENWLDIALDHITEKFNCHDIWLIFPSTCYQCNSLIIFQGICRLCYYSLFLRSLLPGSLPYTLGASFHITVVTDLLTYFDVFKGCFVLSYQETLTFNDVNYEWNDQQYILSMNSILLLYRVLKYN